MSLQTDNLAMIGLGVLGNQPVNPYQAPLADGIHLRWGFLRELGFPWHGFHLFRRPSRPSTTLCLSSVIGGLKKGNWPDTKHYTALGLLSSNTNLVLTEDYTPGKQVEFALDGRNYLRFDLPAGELACRVELRIGFRLACLDVEKFISTATLQFGFPAPPPPVMTSGVSVFRPNPLNQQGMTFEVKGGDGKPADKTQFDLLNTTLGPLVGLACGDGLTIKLPAPSNSVELLITRTHPPILLPPTVIEALDGNNNKVAIAEVLSPANEPQLVKLNGQKIVRIVIRSIRNTVYLHRICSEKLGPEGKGAVKVTAFSGTTPVHSITISGQPGQVALGTLEADAINSIEIGSGPGALVDLCYVPVAQDATQGWQPLPKFSYPLGLPVTQADYPCSVAAPQTLLTQRVHYQLPPGWDNTSFTQVHDQLVTLVAGGPSSAPMVERIFAAPAAQSIPLDPDPPKLSKFYILDMLLLGALHPALAQLIGLYWVDQTAAPNVAYDYLIVADHTGVGQRNASKVLSVIQSSGFAQLDGYIVFNKRRAPAPPLSAPTGLKTYELPGGTFPDVQGQLPLASNNGGLRWDVGWDSSDALLPERAIMYLVWRADLGNAATPAPTGAHNLITKHPPNKPKPVLVTEPRLPSGAVPDWPIDPIYYIDRNLPDGWYSYQVSGIDLFGRHSFNSAPASLRLLDRIPPPMPTAVEAYALDPQDPYLVRDKAYKDWHTSLNSSAQQTLIGLRVRWRWTTAHQRQAPDTHEFRLYFHPGAILPPDRDQATKWQERYYVVAYNDNVKLDSLSGDRIYEAFIPHPLATILASLPLNPSLAEPVVYAHIGVSAADDKPHTTDQRTNGNLSNRPGNEGFVGAPAKIYRVLRDLPPPPESLLDGERYYASPADYHDHSFFTYRWKPQQFLKLHVFRAMDDGVFKADWAQRPLKTKLDESQLDLFPSGWNKATREQIAVELNHLDSFVNLKDGTEPAMAYYRQLSDAALRVLAGLPSSENAFVQLTINPLDPNDTANANRKGPDNPDDLVLDLKVRAFIDTLDGRSTNRYFYRAAAVDFAHNLGPLGPSSPPVYLPNVVPPRAPVITKVISGDRQITLKWASNREPDLAAYRIYRTEIEEKARDVRLMDVAATITQADINLSDPGVEWTDNNLIGGHKYFYRLAAVDTIGNESEPTRVYAGVAVDTRVPAPPIWTEQTWLLRSKTDGGFINWPPDGVVPPDYAPVLRLGWRSETPEPQFVVTRLIPGEQRVWTEPANATLRPSPTDQREFILLDFDADPKSDSMYQLKVRSSSGVWSTEESILSVTPQEGA